MREYDHHDKIWTNEEKKGNKCDEIATSLLTWSLHFMTACCTNFLADMHTNVLKMKREILILDPHWETKATEIFHLLFQSSYDNTCVVDVALEIYAS